MKNSITSSTFPDGVKIAAVVPTDKNTDNKYTASNFRSVSLLNCFSFKSLRELHQKPLS